jgi:rubrerythrin
VRLTATPFRAIFEKPEAVAGWTLDDIPWQAFDAARVDAAIVPVIKTASLVEANAADYRTYLFNVFDDDPRVRKAIDGWAAEEAQHGAALARWARLADPGFDFDECFARFTAGYSIPVAARKSVRGSRAGEFVARCMVEAGTNAHYSMLAEAVREPVLKDICRRIAADELAHYWLFHRQLTRYLDTEGLGVWGRLRVALGRIAEAGDDELSFAFHAANGDGTAYDRRASARSYALVTLGHLRIAHVKNAIRLMFTAVGLDGAGSAGRVAAAVAWQAVKARRLWLAWRIRPVPENR